MSGAPELRQLSSHVDRDTTIKRIRAALKRRSGKGWSVTGGRGTAWGWIHIDAPPGRRTWSQRTVDPHAPQMPESKWEHYDAGRPDMNASPADRAELGRLLGLDRSTYTGGESVAASDEYYREYVDRAEGRTPSKIAVPYWD